MWRWNRKNDVPVRSRGIIQLLFIFIDKIYVLRPVRTGPHTVPPYSPFSGRQIKEKIIPVDSHQLSLQDDTTSCPHERIRLQPFLPSSTHSQRPFHWKFVTRYVRYVHKNTTFQIPHTHDKKLPLPKKIPLKTFVPGKNKNTSVCQRNFFFFQISQPFDSQFLPQPRHQADLITNTCVPRLRIKPQTLLCI